MAAGSPDRTVRWLVTYSGEVQGVGFRYTARRLAAGFRVAGWVKNLPTGEVALAVEGPEREVEGFLAAVAARQAGRIRDASREAQEPRGLDEGFKIAY